ncbi:DoxX family protein [Halopenitus sp. H-Gu1]|uniref:DoxX family protein n=1 Tax=Halopenitus sp. H-Gu1 TaxID=3242697 RepID=UPI00359F0091
MSLEIATIPLQFDAPLSGELFLIARILFGGLMAFMGLNHFLDVENMTGYAEMKGLPAPRLSVTFSGGMLIAGGLGIAIGAYPILAAGALVVFLLVSSPTMHDFWAVPDDQKQSEMTNFLKNIELLAASLAFLALGAIEWPYAVGVGLL